MGGRRAMYNRLDFIHHIIYELTDNESSLNASFLLSLVSSGPLPRIQPQWALFATTALWLFFSCVM